MILNDNINNTLLIGKYLDNKIFVSDVSGDEIILDSKFRVSGCTCTGVPYNYINGPQVVFWQSNINELKKFVPQSIISSPGITSINHNQKILDFGQFKKIKTFYTDFIFWDYKIKNFNTKNLNLQANNLILSNWKNINWHLYNTNIITNTLSMSGKGPHVNIIKNNSKIITKNMILYRSKYYESSIDLFKKRINNFNPLKFIKQDQLDDDELQCILILDESRQKCNVIYKSGSYFDEFIKNNFVKTTKQHEINSDWSITNLEFYIQTIWIDHPFYYYMNAMTTMTDRQAYRTTWTYIMILDNSDAKIKNIEKWF